MPELTVAVPQKVAATATTDAALAKGRLTPVDASAGTRTMTLPTGAGEGRVITVEKVDSSTNPVVVSGSIRGSAGTLSLTSQFHSISFVADSAGSWHPMGDHRTSASLSALFAGHATDARAVASVRRQAPPSLTGATLTTPAVTNLIGLLPDGKGKVFTNAGFSASQIGVTRDGATFTWGKNFQGGAGIAIGFVITPSGEALVSVRDRTTATGTLYRSTGFNPATMDATSWATVLTGSRAGAHFDGRWCLTERSVAPLASPGAGAIYVCEYDGDKVWQSTDDGATWTQIFALQTILPGANHVHGVAYDRWDDRVWVTVGDTAYARIYYANRENIDGVNTRWTMLTGSDTVARQSTTVVPLGAAVVFLSDASDSAVFTLPRRGVRSYGALSVGYDLPGIGLIGAHAYQAADNKPAYFTFYAVSSGQTPRIVATIDGEHFTEVYTDTTNVTTGPGIHSIVGPDTDDYLWATRNISGSGALLRLTASQPAALYGAFVGLAQAAKNPDLLITGAINVDANDLVTTAAVQWPDGSAGTLTITSRDSNGAVLAYNITYGSPVTKTFTQPAITRNANGAATNVPAIVVS